MAYGLLGKLGVDTAQRTQQMGQAGCIKGLASPGVYLGDRPRGVAGQCIEQTARCPLQQPAPRGDCAGALQQIGAAAPAQVGVGPQHLLQQVAGALCWQGSQRADDDGVVALTVAAGRADAGYEGVDQLGVVHARQQGQQGYPRGGLVAVFVTARSRARLGANTRKRY